MSEQFPSSEVMSSRLPARLPAAKLACHSKNSLTIPRLAIGQPQRRSQFSLTSFLKVIITLFASDSQNDLFRYALAHEPGGAG